MFVEIIYLCVGLDWTKTRNYWLNRRGESLLNDPSFYLVLRILKLHFYLKYQPIIISKIIILKTYPKYKFTKLIIGKLKGLLLTDYLEPEATTRFPQPIFYYIFLTLACLSLRLDSFQFFSKLLNLIETWLCGHLLVLSLLFLIFKGLKEEKDHNKLFFISSLTSCFS